MLTPHIIRIRKVREFKFDAGRGKTATLFRNEVGVYSGDSDSKTIKFTIVSRLMIIFLFPCG